MKLQTSVVSNNNNKRLQKGRAQENLADLVVSNDNANGNNHRRRSNCLRNFFDSNNCCFGRIHIKTGTFVLMMSVFHEILIGTIYVCSRLESKAHGSPVARLSFLLASRLVQLSSVGLLYIGLWRNWHWFLLPFVFAQPTIGSFADINTLTFLLAELRAAQEDSFFTSDEEDEAEETRLKIPFVPFQFTWVVLVLALLLYIVAVVAILSVVYRCFIYIQMKKKGSFQQEEERDQQPSRGGQSDAPTDSKRSISMKIGVGGGELGGEITPFRSPQSSIGHGSVSIRFSGGNKCTASNISLSRISVWGPGDDASMRNLAAGSNKIISNSTTREELKSALL